jgi:hypothetical protein
MIQDGGEMRAEDIAELLVSGSKVCFQSRPQPFDTTPTPHEVTNRQH